MNFLAEEVSIIKICADKDCEVAFVPTRHNQKYCSKDCCKRTTNAKIMTQYYERKDRKSGKKRVCKSCGVTPLSRYNEGNTCQSCILAEKTANRLELLQMVGVA